MKYLMNGWYAVALSSELKSGTPLARKILDIPMVFFRNASDQISALEDTCPHRFAPLSAGKIVEGTIQCPYHGLRFDGAGACVHNPHGHTPKAAKVRSFQTYERYGLVWLWPGDAPADHEKVPFCEGLEDPENYSLIEGYIGVNGSYLLVVDNLLDLSHVQFIHPQFASPGRSQEEQAQASTTRVEREPGHIFMERLRPNFPANKPAQEVFGLGPEPCDSRSSVHWYPPSILVQDVGSSPIGRPKEGLHLPIIHGLTPATETTSWYFFVQGYNMKREDPKTGEFLYNAIRHAFEEQDCWIIALQQQRMGDTADFMSLNPILLGTDKAPVAARRELGRLIDAEGT